MGNRYKLRNRHVRWVRSHTPLSLAASLLVVAVALGGCVDERTVFEEIIVEVDRPLFEQPPDATFNFLGLSDVATNLPVCGNCHIDPARQWQGTNHASAWATLQANPNAQAFCEGCHTVSENGNALDEPAGYNLVADERYFNVQCENCHGPGFEHVQNPDGVKPLASAAIDPTVSNGCGDCHSGSHHGFVDEWLVSPHAVIVGFAAGRQPCDGCHNGKVAMARLAGDDPSYLEKDDGAPLATVCVVCHDPHSKRYEHQLRAPVRTASLEENLCAQCHNRRTVPDPGSSHGLHPHAPEAALLIGEAGFFFPPLNPGDIRATHGSERNTETCAACHLAAFEVTDPATGDHVFSATGHLFRPIPCLDEQGVPLPFGNGCEFTPEARSFGSCTTSGCHGDARAVASALAAATARIETWAHEVEEMILMVDPNGEEPGGEVDATDGVITVAEGAVFNHSLAYHGDEDFETNTVVGSTVHNPFLMEALLIASIRAMEAEYGVTSPRASARARSLNEELQAVLDRVPR